MGAYPGTTVKQKYKFLKPADKYFGYGVDNHKLHAQPPKVKTTVEAPELKIIRSSVLLFKLHSETNGGNWQSSASQK